MSYKILIVNDDSYLSPGLYILYDAVKDLGDVIITSTMLPRSAIGHTISFNKPLRLQKIRFESYDVYVTDGTPIDALHLAISVLNFKPNVVLSGVNVGENLSLQHTYYSGTLAIAIEAALLGIPSIAFSADILLFEDFKNEVLRNVIKVLARELTRYVLNNGLPNNVDLLSVNIPSPSKFNKCVKLTKLAKLRWRAEFEMRYDTRGRPYYWLQTKPIEPAKGTDVYATLVEGCISVTPLSIDINALTSPDIIESLSVVTKNLECRFKLNTTCLTPSK